MLRHGGLRDEPITYLLILRLYTAVLEQCSALQVSMWSAAPLYYRKYQSVLACKLQINLYLLTFCCSLLSIIRISLLISILILVTFSESDYSFKCSRITFILSLFCNLFIQLYFCFYGTYYNKKTPEGAYAGCVGLRKNYGYVGWKWKLSSVCNKCVQERRRCSVKD